MCIAKNLILTTLNFEKLIFSIFRFILHPQTPDIQTVVSAKYCPIITNHTSMESLFIQLSDYVYISFFLNDT